MSATEKEKELIVGELGAVGKIEILPIEQLQVDHAYQRELSMDRVNRYAGDYNLAVAGAILVNQRPSGSYWIVNGQHRTAAAARAGETHMIAQVVSLPATSDEHASVLEAQLRVTSNVARADNPQERFRAQVQAADPRAVAIKTIVESNGGKINPWPDANQGINAVSTLEYLYDLDGGAVLSRTMQVIAQVWPDNIGGRGVGAAMMRAIAWFLLKHVDDREATVERMVEQMQREDLDSLLKMARSHQGNMGGAAWVNLYRAIVEAYNFRLAEANRLAWKTGGWSKGGDSGHERGRGGLAQQSKTLGSQTGTYAGLGGYGRHGGLGSRKDD